MTVSSSDKTRAQKALRDAGAVVIAVQPYFKDSRVALLFPAGKLDEDTWQTLKTSGLGRTLAGCKSLTIRGKLAAMNNSMYQAEGLILDASQMQRFRSLFPQVEVINSGGPMSADEAMSELFARQLTAQQIQLNSSSSKGGRFSP